MPPPNRTSRRALPRPMRYGGPWRRPALSQPHCLARPPIPSRVRVRARTTVRAISCAAEWWMRVSSHPSRGLEKTGQTAHEASVVPKTLLRPHSKLCCDTLRVCSPGSFEYARSDFEYARSEALNTLATIPWLFNTLATSDIPVIPWLQYPGYECARSSLAVKLLSSLRGHFENFTEESTCCYNSCGTQMQHISTCMQYRHCMHVQRLMCNACV